MLKLCCHSQRCTAQRIMGAIGMEVGDLYRDQERENGQSSPVRARARIVAEYDYLGEDGEILFQSLRWEPKRFSQRRPDPETGQWIWDLEGVRKVLYRLPELLAGGTRTVLLVEGEKDVHTLESFGFLATTSPCGANHWDDSYCACLTGHPVCVIPDNDTPGLAHADRVVGSLVRSGLVPSVRVLSPLLPEIEGSDVTDWRFSLPVSEQKRVRELLIAKCKSAKCYMAAM